MLYVSKVRKSLNGYKLLAPGHHTPSPQLQEIYVFIIR